MVASSDPPCETARATLVRSYVTCRINAFAGFKQIGSLNQTETFSSQPNFSAKSKFCFDRISIPRRAIFSSKQWFQSSVIAFVVIFSRTMIYVFQQFL